MEKTIKEYGKLTVEQKKEAVELFLIGFGRFMTFSGDEALKKTLFIEIFDPEWFFCYLEGERVLGLMGLGTSKRRPIDFRPEVCWKIFGEKKGRIISKQMNAVFQSKAVKGERDLYIDTLVTDPNARNKGIGSALMEKACSFKVYDAVYTEVFSKNVNAIGFYEKHGFVSVKKEKFSLLRLQGAGYPIKMKKVIA